MGKVTGFLEFQRKTALTRPVNERVKDYREVFIKLPSDELRTQGARCMDCGIPFCHAGCPLNNIIPDWNDLVYKDRWKEALQSLHSTNNFPEFTGRVCPAPCETACVLGINDDPVTIKQIEKSIADRGFFEGWIKPQPPEIRTGKKVAVIGSGPAGMAAAQQMNRAGHTVTLFERADRIGGLLRYGIPDFKMEKHLIDRRVEQMEQEGVLFYTGVNVGVDVDGQALLKDFDAVLISIGSTIPRDLPIPGRDLSGVHFAMEFLPQQNRRVSGLPVDPATSITAKGKKVVIIGGGDTGADCLGTSIRQGAKEIHMLELLPKPPEARTSSMPWPNWPMILRTESSHEEGGKRQWSVATKEFIGKNGVLKKLRVARIEWTTDASGRTSMQEVPGSDYEIEADLVLLAMGFLHPQKTGLVEQLGVALDPRGNIAVNENFATSVPNVFAAGDAQRGQSLVVWALAGGRKAARAIDLHLMGKTNLPV